MFEQHLQLLRSELARAGIDVAIITDNDSVYYYSGYYDYLHMEFGRPTLLMVARDGPSLLITPAIDESMALEHACVDRIEAWNDGLGLEWREHIPAMLSGNGMCGHRNDDNAGNGARLYRFPGGCGSARRCHADRRLHAYDQVRTGITTGASCGCGGKRHDGGRS